jgi:hypothetical protein
MALRQLEWYSAETERDMGKDHWSNGMMEGSGFLLSARFLLSLLSLDEN